MRAASGLPPSLTSMFRWCAFSRVFLAAGCTKHTNKLSCKSLSLKQASYPAVIYIPRADVDMTQLRPTDHTTFCPYKGTCSYFSIPALGAKGENAVWCYEEPFEDVVSIRGALAFYPDRVDIVTLTD